MMIPPSFLDTWQCDQIHADRNHIRESLTSFHLAALKEVVAYAMTNSRFYKKQFQHIQIKGIASLDEFRELPFTFPGHLKENSPSFLCGSRDTIARIVTIETSGTTALPKRIFFTRSDLDNTIAFFTRVLSQLCAPSESALILLPGNTPASAGDLLGTAMAQIGGKGLIRGLITDFNDTAQTLLNQTPSLIIGLPVQILALCEWVRQNNCKTDSVRHVILTSDYASPAIKYRIAQVLNCRVFDHYGMTETGFGGGIDCFAHQGYHVRETDLFFEIIDPNTGMIQPSGQWGEIVVTTLNRQGMPLIRYGTGDVSRFLCDPCSCGSPFKRMDYVRYRTAGLVTLSEGQTLGMPDLDDLFFSIPGVVDFHATLVTAPSGHRLDIVLQVLDRTLFRNIDIQKFLYCSPVVKKAVETGAVRLGPIQTDRFDFTDTYTGKRKIHQTDFIGK